MAKYVFLCFVQFFYVEMEDRKKSIRERFCINLRFILTNHHTTWYLQLEKHWLISNYNSISTVRLRVFRLDKKNSQQFSNLHFPFWFVLECRILDKNVWLDRWKITGVLHSLRSHRLMKNHCSLAPSVTEAEHSQIAQSVAVNQYNIPKTTHHYSISNNTKIN